MLVYVVLAMIVIVCIFSVRISNETYFLERKTTDFIKGIAIIVIFLHHILNKECPNNFIMNGINIYAGYLLTGVFFMLSGYGNYISLNKFYKKESTTAVSWLKPRIINIYLTFIIVYIAVVLIKLITFQSLPIWYENIINVITLTLPSCSTWFLKVLLVCYVLEALFIKKFSIKRAGGFLLICWGVYVGICIFNHVPSKWYSSAICFPIGFLLGSVSELLKTYINSRKNSIRKKYVSCCQFM